MFAIPRIKSILLLLAMSVYLAACGEGYEIIRTTEIAPYGNSRTAGSGVAYVRAKLLPAKTLKVAEPESVRTPKMAKAKKIRTLRAPKAEKTDVSFIEGQKAKK